jgi:hypothetical protein
MDGYWFLMGANGNLHNSNLNSLGVWPADGYIPMSGGGKGLGCVRLGRYIVGFSDYTTELFENVGNAAGSVLGRVRDGVMRIGAMRNGGTQPTFRVIGDAVYWIGQNAESGSRGVFRLKSGGSIEKISNTAIDKMAADSQLGYIAGGFSMLGMTHIAFSSSATTLLCYCVETKYWWILTASALSPFAMIGGAALGGFSKAYLLSSNSAKIYTFNPNSPVWQDNGTTHTMTVRTANLDLNTRHKKFWESFGVVGDSQTTTSTLNISYSDDDFATFSSTRPIDMSVVPPVRLTRLGASRRRAWQITHSDPTPCRLTAVEVEYDLGNN